MGWIGTPPTASPTAPQIITATFRGVVVEDFLTATTFGPATVYVMGAGDGITVSPFVVAINDAAAAAAGVPISAIYIVTASPGNSYMRARMS